MLVTRTQGIVGVGRAFTPQGVGVPISRPGQERLRLLVRAEASRQEGRKKKRKYTSPKMQKWNASRKGAK
jgi:hypothetical protein